MCPCLIHSLMHTRPQPPPPAPPTKLPASLPQGWQFLTLRAWSTVANRRGYLLEEAAAFLGARGAAPGDTLLVYRDSDLTPPVGRGGVPGACGDRAHTCLLWGALRALLAH